ncbi:MULTISPECIES: AraC family transcriptional regulator [unclassified Roseateles]|uniref:AraC family transcriptional regulator n=1 Tax=unclassified Roseateles TaxID=2626991 RepID=UPI0006FE4430|nr:MULTISPECIES: AraC family transcriptional regulator [unclassified Roseateles]KQW44793.1 AraC family transcriptional regulator [Pelomonas sp. Root405]KRA70152.1 AraC family transcriptional regulator [Pelomonas sp. Root662]
MSTRRGIFQLLPSGLAGIEAVVADSAHAFGRHTHEQFGIGLIERGAQKSASGRGVVEAGPGDLITVNPGEVHDGKPFDASGRRWRMLYADPAQLIAAAGDVMPSAGFEFKAPVIRDNRLAMRFSDLFDAATAGSDALHAETALLTLTAALLQPRPETAAAGGHVIAARERMDDEPGAALTLTDLAAEAGLSRYQFLRAFTRLTGLPPHAYLLQRRVQRARQLVRAGQPLAEAAAASGFADQSHMTRCFVRSFGLTPGAYSRP